MNRLRMLDWVEPRVIEHDLSLIDVLRHATREVGEHQQLSLKLETVKPMQCPIGNPRDAFVAYIWARPKQCLPYLLEVSPCALAVL